MPQLRHRWHNEVSMIAAGEKNKGAGLCYDSLMAALPTQTGQVLKLGVSALFLFLPAFVKQWILKWRCLAMLRPTWKTRRLILLGRFLYKFDGETKDDDVAGRNVGAPIDVLDIEVSLVESAEAERFDISECLSILPDWAADSVVIRVATFRKTYYFACPSREEALVWIRSLQDARHETIRRAMGHTDVGSHSKSWEYFDSLGQRAAATNERIRLRMESNNLRELEMSNFMDSGPLPRGYFG
jgi:hypothetical protein